MPHCVITFFAALLVGVQVAGEVAGDVDGGTPPKRSHWGDVAAFDARTVVSELVRMERQTQQDWLTRFEWRWNHVCEVLLPEEAASLERARLHTSLRQKNVPLAQLTKLIGELDAKERKAVDHLASTYRSTTYRTFRRQRAALEERRNAWNETFGAWEQAGCCFDQQDWLIGWLELAIRNCERDDLGPIPSPPPFANKLPVAWAPFDRRPNTTWLPSVSATPLERLHDKSPAFQKREALGDYALIRAECDELAHSFDKPSQRRHVGKPRLTAFHTFAPLETVKLAATSERLHERHPSVQVPGYGAEKPSSLPGSLAMQQESADPLPTAVSAAHFVVQPLRPDWQEHRIARRERPSKGAFERQFATRVPQPMPETVRRSVAVRPGLPVDGLALPVAMEQESERWTKRQPRNLTSVWDAAFHTTTRAVGTRSVDARTTRRVSADPLERETSGDAALPTQGFPEAAEVACSTSCPVVHVALAAAIETQRPGEVSPKVARPEVSEGVRELPAGMAIATRWMQRHRKPLRSARTRMQVVAPCRMVCQALREPERLAHTVRSESHGVYLVSPRSVVERRSPLPRTPEPWAPQSWQSDLANPVPSNSATTVLIARRRNDVTRLLGNSTVAPPALHFPSLEPRNVRVEKSMRSRVQINLGELASQIANSNHDLRSLEAELRQAGPWTTERLRTLVRRLDVLVVQQEDLRTFRDVVAQKDRALVGWVESPRATIAQAAARLYDIRTRVSGAKYTGTEADRYLELQQLNELSKKLVQLAARR